MIVSIAEFGDLALPQSSSSLPNQYRNFLILFHPPLFNIPTVLAVMAALPSALLPAFGPTPDSKRQKRQNCNPKPIAHLSISSAFSTTFITPRPALYPSHPTTIRTSLEWLRQRICRLQAETACRHQHQRCNSFFHVAPFIYQSYKKSPIGIAQCPCLLSSSVKY